MAKDPFGYKTIRQQPTKPPTITEEKASELISTLRTLDTSPVPAIKGKYYIFGWFLDFDPLPFFLGIGTTDAKYDQSFGKDLRLSSDTVPQSEPTININPIHREQSEKGTACISIFEVIKRLNPPPIFSALAIQTEINWNDVIYLHQALLLKVKSLGGCRLMPTPQAIVQLAPLFPYPNPSTEQGLLEYIPNTEVITIGEYDQIWEDIENRAYDKYDELKNRRAYMNNLPTSRSSTDSSTLMSTTDFLSLQEEEQDAYLDSLDPRERKRMRDAVRAKLYRDRQKQFSPQEPKPTKPTEFDPWGIHPFQE